jgi:hypothetical protein
MNRIIKCKLPLLAIVFLNIILLASCDVIDSENRVVPGDFYTVDESKTVLLEDFTGVYCNNCPTAAATAQTIKETLKEQLIIVSVHAGPFATPVPNTQDFRTEAGTEYQKRFYPANNSYPAGMVSRTDFDGNVISTDFSKWYTYITERILQVFPMILKLSLKTSYDANEQNCTVESTIEALSPVAGEIKLQLWLTESHIISPQLSKTGFISDYEHNHVLRDAVNGVWGENVQAGQGEKSVYTNTYSLKGKIWKPENMDVVGFLYDANTMQVLYATETKLINN